MPDIARKIGAALVLSTLPALPLWAGDGPALAAARAWRAAHGAEILRDFTSLLALPNVASDLPAIERNAAAIRDAFARRGARMELLRVAGAPPVVFGELAAQAGGADAPTLVLYAHYDGQPVDRARWTHGPWQPTLYTAAREDGGAPRPLPAPGEAIDPEWRLYARSAGDDKAPIAAILAAVDALADAGVPRTVAIKLFFEGEEEAGSPHLDTYVRTFTPRLAADAWLFLDGPVHQTGRPQVFFGARGITGLDVTVYGANRYLHSGHYGNWAPNPNLRLARLLASMKDEDGRVLVTGFYDSDRPRTEAERRELDTVPDFEADLRRELGLAASEAGNARYMDRMLLPSLNIRGMAGATVGASARNVIPPEATASIDMRLVPGNDPSAMLDLVEAHIRRQGYHVVHQDPNPETRLAYPKIAKVVRHPGYRAVETRADLPIVRRVVGAVRAAATEPVVLLPLLGGSLPLYVFEDHLGAPLVGVPIANHDDNQHAPDENLRIANLWYGIDLFAEVLTLPPASDGAAR